MDSLHLTETRQRVVFPEKALRTILSENLHSPLEQENGKTAWAVMQSFQVKENQLKGQTHLRKANITSHWEKHNKHHVSLRKTHHSSIWISTIFKRRVLASACCSSNIHTAFCVQYFWKVILGASEVFYRFWYSWWNGLFCFVNILLQLNWSRSKLRGRSVCWEVWMHNSVAEIQYTARDKGKHTNPPANTQEINTYLALWVYRHSCGKLFLKEEGLNSAISILA